MKAVGVIDLAGGHLGTGQSGDQVAGWRHVILLTGPDEANRQAERVYNGMDLGVPKQPRERQRAWASGPSFAPRSGGLRVGADDGGVDRQPFEIGIVGHRLKQLIEHPHFNPPAIAPLGCLIGPEPLWQITPAGSRARHQQGIKEPVRGPRR